MIFAAALLATLLQVGGGIAAEPEVEPPDLSFRDGQIVLTPGEINTSLRFELFQQLLREGAISEAEFRAHRQPNIGALLPFSHEPGSAGLDGPVPTLDEVLQSFRELRKSVNLGAARAEDAVDMRGKILAAILPPKPRQRAAPPPRPQNMMDALLLTSHLAGFRGRGVITEAEFEVERKKIDDLAQSQPTVRVEPATPIPEATIPSKVATAKPASKPPLRPQGPAAKAAVAPAKSAGDFVDALPVPRFVSLRADEVVMRDGPGEEYAVDWVYRRQFLPVEVVAQSANWRRIRDPDGTEGWVHYAMLVGRRTGMIRHGPQALRAEADDVSRVIGSLDDGLIVDIRRCPADFAYCRIAVADTQGWIRRDAMWGIYPAETIE